MGDDYTEVWPEKMKTSSNYIGVSCNKRNEIWYAQRYSKNEKKLVYNGTYKDEETAARASDTLARKLMANSNQNLELNFPFDHIEVWLGEMKTSKYIGVSYNKERSKWYVQRQSKNEKKLLSNGTYKDEDTAAHASDTLARKLIENGEH